MKMNSSTWEIMDVIHVEGKACNKYLAESRIENGIKQFFNRSVTMEDMGIQIQANTPFACYNILTDDSLLTRQMFCLQSANLFTKNGIG